MLDKDKAINLAPEAIRLAIKAVKFAKGGFTAEERMELVTDLLDLAAKLIVQDEKQ